MSAQSGYYDDGLGSRELEVLGERVEHTLGNEAKPDAIDADVAFARVLTNSLVDIVRIDG
jgi:hypothetical protein